MFISAEKVHKFAEGNKNNNHNITLENSILYAAMKGEMKLLWEAHISQTGKYELIEAGYEIKEVQVKGQTCYEISWEKISV